MKMVVVMSLCRRYHEAARNLARLRERADAELSVRPEVLLVWARPELGRFWFVRELLEQGLVSHVLGRPALEGEGDDRATTTPESHNVRLGLEWVKKNRCAESYYVLFLAADVHVKDGVLAAVDQRMQQCDAVLFHWENGVSRSDCWHTNFFAVRLEPHLWPPLMTPGKQDVLERSWGRQLASGPPFHCFRWHNHGEKRFAHRHESEKLPPFPCRAECDMASLPLCARGHRTWLDVLRGVVSSCWQKMRRLTWRPLWRRTTP